MDDKLKRINPDTGKFFKRGDKKPKFMKQDGKVFLKYEPNRFKDGMHFEYWCEPEFIQQEKEVNKKWRNTSEKLKRDAIRPFFFKRLDKDGKEFVHGRKYGDKWFVNYETHIQFYFKRNINKPTAWDEIWTDDVNVILEKKLKSKARNSGLDYEYIKSIFPDDYKCPITRLPFTWERTHPESPELDRVDSTRGYEKGNVVWICRRMNRLKNDCTQQELLRLSQYISAYSSISSSQRKELIEKFKEDMEEQNVREGNTGIGE